MEMQPAEKLETGMFVRAISAVEKKIETGLFVRAISAVEKKIETG